MDTAGQARKKADLVLKNIGELVTMSGHSSKPVKFPDAGALGVLKTSALCVATTGEKISFLGREQDLRNALDTASAREINCEGKLVLPGFVDSHTHAIFAGSRENELAMKLQGASYLDILKSGGGILRTVKQTNDAPDEVILNETRERLDRMISFGTTTVEVKTGYSLSVSGEIRLLELLRRLKSQYGYDIEPTLLSAHAVSSEYAGKAGQYIEEVVIPSVNVCSERRLATFCDVFLEQGVFGYSESERILTHASRVGLKTKIHADEFSDQRGAELGARLGVTSADHLARSSLEGIDLLARKGIVAVLLPGTMFSSFSPSYAKARQFIDSGAPVAIATDLSPNSWIESMQFVMCLACYGMRMTVEEALVAATINGAHAIGRAQDIGSVEVGKKADLLITDVSSYLEVPYRVASNVVTAVVKSGRVVREN